MPLHILFYPSLQVHVGSDLLDFGPLFSGEKSLCVGEVEVVELEVGGDGGLSPDLGELGVVSQNQSAQDHVLDDGVEKEVEGTNTCRQAEEDQQKTIDGPHDSFLCNLAAG